MSAKILLLDIETSPKRAYTWGLWKQNIGLNQLESDMFVLCWCAKWLGDGKSKVMFDALTNEEVTGEDDSNIMGSLHELLNEADIVIGHNGDKFDIPTVNSRFVIHGFQPPDRYKTVDTLKIAKSKFKFTSNRLDALGQFLGVGRKVDTGGFQLWADVMSNKPKAMQKMVRYCKQDVNLLEAVYLRLRPWDSRHPNIAMYTDGSRPVCNVCGSEHVQKRGFASTNAKLYQRWKCGSCGHEMRSPYSEKDKRRDQTRLMST